MGLGEYNSQFWGLGWAWSPGVVVRMKEEEDGEKKRETV